MSNLDIDSVVNLIERLESVKNGETDLASLADNLNTDYHELYDLVDSINNLHHGSDIIPATSFNTQELTQLIERELENKNSIQREKIVRMAKEQLEGDNEEIEDFIQKLYPGEIFETL